MEADLSGVYYTVAPPDIIAKSMPAPRLLPSRLDALEEAILRSP